MFGLKVLLIKAIKALLPGQVSVPQQPLAPCGLAVVDLLLAQGIEVLARASARRAARRAPPTCLSLLRERLPVAAPPRQLELFEQQGQRRFHYLGAEQWGGGGHRRPAGVGE